MRAYECERPFVAAAAGTVSGIELTGGAYVLDLTATGAGTCDFYRLGPDSATYVSVMTQLTANGTSGGLTLPPGLYRVVVAGFTVVYVSITRVPGE